MSKLTDAKIDQLYTSGMHFANALRVVGRHEEAHDTELWVLGLQADLKHERDTDAYIEHKANWECR